MQNEASIDVALSSLLTRLDAEITQDTNQLEAIQKRLQKNEKLRTAVKNALGAAMASEDNGDKIEDVRQAVQNIHVYKAKFTQADIEEEIKRANANARPDRARVRIALWTLANKQNFIKQVKQGTNREPAEYEVNTQAINGAHRAERGVATNSGVISISQVEAYLSKCSKRMSDIADHFHVTEGTIRQLIDGSARIVEGERGWIKIRE